MPTGTEIVPAETSLLLLNPYDYNTVQSNPGLLALLHVLDTEKHRYAMTVAGRCATHGSNLLELPEKLLDTGSYDAELLRSTIRLDDFTHLVAIDPEGAMLATRLLDTFGKTGIDCSYISYEILFSDEVLTADERRLKEYDTAFLQRCSSVLIQDETRGSMFNHEHGRNFRHFYSPVAPIRYLGKPGARTGIRTAVGIPPDRKILVYSGSLSPYAKHDWWIRIAETLPSEFVFLITCYDSNQLRDPGFARIGRILSNIGNVYFLGKELPADAHMQLLQACDAGLALFRPVYTHWMNGRNIRQIGLSSGKFSTYISCGLPVICDHEQEIFRKLEASYPVVQTIAAPEELAEKLALLSAQPGAVETGCRQLFNEVLNPATGIRDYLAALNK
jgi:glycosyltransferase involved in cell wall biosynthesis